MTHAGESAAPVHCTARRRGVTLLTLCLAVLVAQVDTAVVNLATRAIGAYFHAGVGALQWVVDSYNLAYAVLLLSGGLLADLYGRRRVFLAGTAVFTVASLLCALAPSVPVLIGARALAGVGAALLLPASLAIVRVVWRDPVERGRALGIWAACNGVAMAIGPTVGGVLIRHFGWRSIFFVVVPLSVAAMLLAIPAVPESSDPRGRHFDAGAQVAGALALGTLAYAAIVFRDSTVASAIAGCVAVASFAAFIAIERRHGDAALVPLDLFGIRAFRGAIAATAGMTFGMYGVLFLLPLTWQSIGRLDATGAGLALLPMALVFVVVSPCSGPLSERVGTRTTTAGGVAVIASGLAAIGASAASPGLLGAGIGLALTGLGMGIATGPLMTVAVGAVDSARSGTASALVNVARMTGATLGIAVLGTLFAAAHGGVGGLRAAMFAGAAVQLTGAAVSAVTVRRVRASAS
ncbi:MFS transporter [Burkholderia pseudomultivorans]|uniref:Major facilitator transporter n=1 Tax=Burkholderia pseudomultivorans TaxID=1207504 RepID=A0A6P2IJE0_9BURK|nr:MFS transporter [Burkholderia pseudomultivorans]MDR8726293.1 Multidrug resistance protein Stp [Burkholderia pseudomultivorans]MDR8733517.1 Multidrug resistance protein Stp [Burkholderia pseudomultivorans]MDR8740043.1 Multidrug resistance protein Stp [Burkholderia pseudomultivorans]MDR8756194.1 Multidrug resistance protein Stp [Burkholderia pseudomultivorans]MDR8776684.1 Multidrug resistance protein Stp [Burkholderia pseudomultivorans]